MSCDFNFCCVECGSESNYSDLNWGQGYLAALMKYRLQLEAPGLFQDPELRSWISGGPGQNPLSTAVEFFGEHVGHKVVVISEYGQIYPHHEGACGGGDTGNGFCGLQKGHVEPEHQFMPIAKVEWSDVTGRRWVFP